MRRPRPAVLALSGVLGSVLPVTSFVIQVAPRINRLRCAAVGSGSSDPATAAGVLVEPPGSVGAAKREESPSHPLATTCSRVRPLVHSKQVSPQELQRRWPDSNFDVPVDLPEAAKAFAFGSPTPGLIAAGILSVAAARVFLSRIAGGAPLGLADAVALPVVAVGWSVQEWAVHKYLLHGLKDWLGHDVHSDHHAKPYYHVCVDPPDLVAAWTLAAACVFGLVLPLPLALTVLAAYMSMGLLYEWVHFIVHTRVVPRTRIGRSLKRHHTLHHLKDETCWLAFTAPAIDTLFGTVPPPAAAGGAIGPVGRDAAGAVVADVGAGAVRRRLGADGDIAQR